ncbi:hypothetical protein AZI87_01130 [Bdellovibrio bacteriovorus]|uniref:Phosphatidic acid phosphatase type 2/haloperoxidase domain-containing protein n=2 Tax=Bdellovibrio bacteriovorus TaxID=959 RepID=A0A162GDT2_BDEBC|nr:hypothetical protein AZI87_01130 [Bdellovibrio bacteriovorus]
MKYLLSFLIVLSGPFAHGDDMKENLKTLEPRNFWEYELKPTIVNSFDTGGQMIFLSGALSVAATKQYDRTIYLHNLREEDKWMDSNVADIGGYLGSGGPGIAIAVLQLALDPVNGVAHSKALMLTAATHITTAFVVNRERPSGRDRLSFPSGHSSSAFATATSLAYAYGYKAGIPAYLAATFIGVSRVNENIHWASDVVAGAALGIYWGRAAALNTGKSFMTVLPILDGETRGLSLAMEF